MAASAPVAACNNWILNVKPLKKIEYVCTLLIQLSLSVTVRVWTTHKLLSFQKFVSIFFSGETDWITDDPTVDNNYAASEINVDVYHLAFYGAPKIIGRVCEIY